MNVLEKTIYRVLSKYTNTQTNLSSDAARKIVSQDVSREIEKTFYPVMVRAVLPHDDTLTIDMDNEFDY